MEPVTYFVTYGTAMAAYAYFVLTKQVSLGLVIVRRDDSWLVKSEKSEKPISTV
jgi:Mitochondrial calcium uniporter